MPVDKNIEFCPKTQLAILAEVLLSHRQKLQDILDRDFAASAMLVASKKGELPSIANVLQAAGWMGRFYKQLKAVLVDEFKELMDSVDLAVALNSRNQTLAILTEPFEEQDWPELMRTQNLKFLNEVSGEPESMPLEPQLDCSEDDVMPILIDEELLCFIKWEAFQEEPSLPQPKLKTAVSGRILPLVKQSADSTTDYSYYQFIVQKNGKEHPKDEREDNETSTKSEGQHEETDTAQIDPVREVRRSTEPDDQSTENALVEPAKTVPKAQLQAKSKKRKKKLSKPKPVVEAKKEESVSASEEEEEESLELELPPSQKSTARKLDREQEKIKQTFNEQFDEMLARADEVDNLDEYERCCVQIINAHDSITKKMKQKKRKALRLRIDRVKELRLAEATEQEYSDQYEDQYVDEEDSEYEHSSKLSPQDKEEEEFLKKLLNGQGFYCRGMLPDGIKYEDLLNDRRSGRPIQLLQQVPARRALKQGQGSKWKERLTDSIKQRHEKMSEYRHKLDKAFQMNRLFAAHRDSKLTPLLSILHEGSVCLDELVHIERRKKETRVIFALPNNSYLADNDFH